MKNSRNWFLRIGLALLLLLLFFMFLGPELPFVDKTLTPVPSRWTADKKLVLPKYKPSPENPLGSNKNGVDNLSMLVMGTKETVYLIVTIAFLRYLIGVPLGLLARKGKGFFSFLVAILNQTFSFLPTLISAVLILSAPFLLFSDHRLFWVLFLLAFIEAGRVADLVAVRTRDLTREPYMEAGRVLGLSSWRMIKNYYLPGLLPEIIVGFTLDVGKVMLLIGQLGVLSIFITQDWMETGYYFKEFVDKSINWVGILAANRADIFMGKFSFIFYPALAIMYVVLTFNLIGEGLRVRYLSKRRVV